MRVNFYVDGFNLYYGALRGSPYRWLDLGALAAILSPPGSTIGQIRYFTANVSGRFDPGSPIRQEAYLRALRTIPGLTVHLGKFLTHQTRMPLVSPAPNGARTALVWKTEEKASDVNLATHLLLDAVAGDFDLAIVVSNDSDLGEPIRITTERYAPVGVYRPNRRHSGRLQAVAAWYKPVFPASLRRARFPAQVRDSTELICKPATW